MKAASSASHDHQNGAPPTVEVSGTGANEPSTSSEVAAGAGAVSSNQTEATQHKKGDWLKSLVLCQCCSCSPFSSGKRVTEFRTVIPNHRLPADTPAHLHPNSKFAGNEIQTTKYSILTFIPKNLFEQFHRFANLYFVFIVVLNWMPGIEAFGRTLSVIPIFFVLSVTAIKDLFEDYRRYRSDKKINQATCRVWNREQLHYSKRPWRDLKVGDFVHVGCNEIIPADLLLVRSSDELGICFVETSNLDGESNLKQRQVIGSRLQNQLAAKPFTPAQFRAHVHCEHPNNQIYRFNGFLLHEDVSSDARESVNKNNLLLRGCEIRNTDFVEGRETKAMLNNSGPRYKRSELERLMNWDIVWCVVLLLIMCVTGAIGSTIWLNSYGSAFNDKVPFLTYLANASPETIVSPDFEGFLNFWTYVIVLQVMIPISLYVTIEVVKLGQVYFIVQDVELYHAGTDKAIQCRALNIPEELGQIEYVMSDKTGTLTENKMVFRRCAVNGVDYAPAGMKDQLLDSSMNAAHDNVWDVTPNKPLLDLLHEAAVQGPEESESAASLAFEFMLNMTICNTVVVNSRAHQDNMSASGYLIPGQSTLHPTGSFMDTSVSSMSRTDQSKSWMDQSKAHEKSTHSHSRKLSTVPEMPTSPATARLARANAMQLPTDTDNAHEAVHHNANEQPPEVAVTDASPPASPNPKFSSSNAPVTNRSMSSSRSFPGLPRPSSLLQLKEGFKSGLSGSLSPMFRSRKNLSPGNTSRAESPAPANPIYEAESPDELSLVHAAAAYRMRLIKRQLSTAIVELPNGHRERYEILHTLPFDSDRKRMSVVVRWPRSGRLVLYCKGADVNIINELSQPFVDSDWGGHVLYKSQQYISLYSSYGLRTLCLAKRELSAEQYAEWLELHEKAETDIDDREQLVYESAMRIEQELHLLGVTGIEDRLQDGVADCIGALRQAGIKVWVLTGDKIETAVNIAYASRLFSPGMELMQLKASTQEETSELLDVEMDRLMHRHTNKTHSRNTSALSGHRTRTEEDGALLQPVNGINTLSASVSTQTQLGAAHRQRSHRGGTIGLVVDGRTLAFCLQPQLEDRFTQIIARCTSVLCCRSTPLQKASVVRLAKEKLKGKTLAIGDGANDVSMIQCADVGVGLSGQEGMQAVMSSDFALARFRFLRRLLLVHGHWCYDRLARTVLYFFYKNALFVFTVFWYQLFCGFSGQVMIDAIYLMFYNLLFTSLPPFLLGVFDQSAPDQLLMEQPRLYAYGRRAMGYRWHSFWVNILDAVWQSITIYFVAHFTYFNSSVDIWSFGFLVTTALVIINQLHLALEVQSWTLPLFASIFVSLGIFFGFALIYHEIVQPSFGVKDLPVSIDLYAMRDPKFWLCILLMTVLALLPRFTVLTLANMNQLSSALSTDVLYARYCRHADKQNKQEHKWNVWWNRDRAVRILPDTTQHTLGAV